MSEMMNIGGVVDDHYRYKMPVPKIKVEGKGNGIKTVIINMTSMAKALKVPPQYMTKFFGFSLGTQNSYNESTERCVVNGQIDISKVHEMIADFVNKYVLCAKCKYPETIINIEKGAVLMKCQACGHVGQADPQHKLTTYIVKNPPASSKSKNQEMVEKKQSEQFKEANDLQSNLKENFEWSTDLSEEAVKKRREEEGLSDRIKTLTLTQDFEEEEIIISPVDLFQEYISKRPNATDQQLLRACQKIKKDYQLKDSDVVSLLCESLFDSPNLLNLIKKKGKILHRYVKTTLAQKLVLAYLEIIIAKDEELQKVASLIIESLYDQEILDEEILVDWFPKKKGKFLKDASEIEKVKTGVKPFMNWLEQAKVEGEA